MKKPEQKFPTLLQLKQSGVSKKIKRVDANPKATWEERALVRVEVYARFNAAFLCEDVAEWAYRVTGLPMPQEPRAWGGVMSAASRDAYVKATEGFALTQYGTGNSKPMRLWTSEA